MSLSTPSMSGRPSISPPSAPLAVPRETLALAILLAASFSHGLNDTIQAVIPAVYPLLKERFTLDFAQVGYITLAFQMTASILQPFVGLFTDRRPLPYSLAAGMGVTLVGLVLLSRAGSFPMILVSAALVGAGSAVFHPEASRVARMASGGRYGLAQSVFQVGGNAGSSLGPLLAAVIVMPRGHGQPYIAWFCLLALLGIGVLATVGHWYAGRLRLRHASGGWFARAGRARADGCGGCRSASDARGRLCHRRADRVDLFQVFLPGEHDELLSVLPDRPFWGVGAAGTGPPVHFSGVGGGGDAHRRAGRGSLRAQGRDLGVDPGCRAVLARPAARRPVLDDGAVGVHWRDPGVRLFGDPRVCAGTPARQGGTDLRTLFWVCVRHGRHRLGGAGQSRGPHEHPVRVRRLRVPALARVADGVAAGRPAVVTEVGLSRRGRPCLGGERLASPTEVALGSSKPLFQPPLPVLSTTATRRQSAPRRPLAGLALAAVAGILLADGTRRFLLSAWWEDDSLPWIAGALFLALAAAFVAWPRAWTFWPAAVAGFAALHFFQADPVPAAVLARALALPDSTGRGAHIIRAAGRVDGPPRLLPDGSPAASQDAPPTSSWRFVFALEKLTLDGQTRLGRARVMVLWRDGPRALADGDRLELTGLASNLRGPRNPGEFDNAALQQRRGIYSELRVTGLADGRVAGSDGSPWLSALAARVHDAMENTLRTDLGDDPEAGAVVSTMLLGLRDDPGLGELEGMFQRTGTLHYFAVDGLKLGLIGAVLLQALAAVGLSRAAASVFVLPLLAVYALATGLGPASARALLVAAALLGGRWLDRSARPINHLGAAALILLCCDTNELFAVGFQLTFLVVLSILLFAPGLARWLGRLGAPDPFLPAALFSRVRQAWEWLRQGLCGLFAVALAAWIGSLPVMALDFGVVSPISPVANVVAFPLAFAVVAMGTLSLGGAWAAHWWVVCINNANWLAAHGLLAVVRAFDAVPGGSVAIPDPSEWRWGNAPLVEVTVLDLGRSRAAYLRAGRGTDWLIDAGRPGAYVRSVRPALRAFGVTRLGARGGLILTRPDSDHVSAAPMALGELSPRQVVDAALAQHSLSLRDFRRALDPARQQETRVGRGSVIDLAPGAEARVLYPPNDPPPPAPVTAASRALVLQMCVADRRGGQWRVLLLPDGADGRVALWLTTNETAEALRSTVLVTDAPVTAEFVRAVGARLVVVRSQQEDEDAPVRKVSLPTLPGVEFIVQEDSGAVNLRVYPDRVEARGFVDGRKVIVR